VYINYYSLGINTMCVFYLAFNIQYDMISLLCFVNNVCICMLFVLILVVSLLCRALPLINLDCNYITKMSFA